MTKRIISVIAIIALININIGCSTYMRVNKEEIEKPYGKVTSVRMSFGNVITFDSQGGRLDAKRRLITGTSYNGFPAEIKLDEIQSFVISTEEGSIEFDKKRIVGPNQVISSIVKPSGEVITFNYQGGRFDPELKIIEGETKDGTLVQVNLDDVDYVQLKKFNASQSVAAILGVSAIFLIFIGICINKQITDTMKK